MYVRIHTPTYIPSSSSPELLNTLPTSPAYPPSPTYPTGGGTPGTKKKFSKVSALVYLLHQVTMESSSIRTFENLCLLARGSLHVMTPQLLHPHPPPRACAGAMPQRRLRRVGRWLRTGCPPSRAQRHRPASALRRPPPPPSPPHPHHRASSGYALGGLALLRRRLSPTVRRN